MASERRDQIARVALQLIAERGVASLTTSTLAKALGVTTGALFRHYRSMDALLVEVAARVERELLTTLPVPGPEPLERIASFVRARAGLVGGDPGVLRLVLSEQFSLALPAKAANTLHGVVVRTREALVKVLSHGVAIGAVRTDVPVDDLALIIMGTTRMLALAQDQQKRRTASDGDVVRTLMKLLQPPTSKGRRT